MCIHTALHYACWNNRTEIVKELLRHPTIDPNIKDKKHGQTPLDQALDPEIETLLKISSRKRTKLKQLTEEFYCYDST